MRIWLAAMAVLLLSASFYAAGSVIFNVTWNNETTKQYPLISLDLTPNYTLLCGGGDCNDVRVYLYSDQTNPLTAYRYKLVNYTYYNSTVSANNHTFTTCSLGSCYAHLIGNWTMSGSYLINFTTDAGNQENQLGVMGDNFAFSGGRNNGSYTLTGGVGNYIGFNGNGMTSSGTAGGFGVIEHRYPYEFGRITMNVSDSVATNSRWGVYLGNTTNTVYGGGNYGCDDSAVPVQGCSGYFFLSAAAPSIGYIDSHRFTITNLTTLLGGGMNEHTKSIVSTIWGLKQGTEWFVNGSINATYYPNGLHFMTINNWTRRSDADYFSHLQFRLYGELAALPTIFHDYCIASNIATIDKFGCAYSNLTTGYNFSETTFIVPPPPPNCLNSDFAITIVPNMSNASTNITATAYYTGAATYTSYNWSARTWNNTLINWNASASTNFVVNVSNYTDIGPRIFIDARGINGTCQTPIVTNSTLVLTQMQMDLQGDYFAGLIIDFWTVYLPLILAIVSMAMGYAFAKSLFGTSWISATSLITALLWFICWLIARSVFSVEISALFFGSIVLTVLGFILKHGGI